MQPNPHEVWATYSVKDHCEPRAFIADVMLYNKLVLPVPSKEEVDGKPEWVRWEEADWQPYQQKKLIEMLGEAAIKIPWTLERQGRWKKRHDALREDAFWLTADLLSGELPIYAVGRAATVGPAYPSLKELQQDLNPVSDEARKPVPGAALPVVLGQKFLVIDDPSKSFEYQLKAALDLARDPEFMKQRASLTQWQQQFMRDGITDRASIVKALEVMNDLIEAQQAAARKTPLQMVVRYGYRIGLAVIGVASAALGGDAGIGLAVGGAFMSVGELPLEAKLLEANPSLGPDRPSPAAFFIAAKKALTGRRPWWNHIKWR